MTGSANQSMSSPRKRGPIRRGLAFGTVASGFCSNKRRWLMGPRFRGDDDGLEAVIARSEATKQSIVTAALAVDCFAEPVIGRAFARPVGSQ
jgi:hypothetical protein